MAKFSTLAQAFSWEFCELFKNTFFTEHLWATVSSQCQSLFFNKVAGLKPVILFKKRLWHRCFPVDFRKFLGTPFHRKPVAGSGLIDDTSILHNFKIHYLTLENESALKKHIYRNNHEWMKYCWPKYSTTNTLTKIIFAFIRELCWQIPPSPKICQYSEIYLQRPTICRLCG